MAMLWVSQDRKTERKLSFDHFSRQSHRLAVLFGEKFGIKKGEKMLIIMPRLPEWDRSMSSDISSRRKDVEYRINRSGSSAFVGDTVSVQKALNVQQRCPTLKHIFQVDGNGPDNVVLLTEALKAIPENSRYQGPKPALKDPSMVYFTSGTTGPPKMVVHNQISYPLASTITGKYFHRLEPGQLSWVLTKQGWAKAAWAFLGAWDSGAGLFIYDDRKAFSAQGTLDILHEYPITRFCAPPTVYRQLVLNEGREHYRKRPAKSLQHCTGAGEPLNPEVIRLWLEMSGLEICDGFGQTETTILCGNFSEMKIRPGSMGKPSPGTPLHVIEENGNKSADNVEGDIAVKVDLTEKSNFFGVFDGYLEDGKLDRKLRECRDTGFAWYCTGDRATRDSDGYFWFVGRSDDVINSAGYRIGPFEVESTLKQHPAVVESAVVSSPDKLRGEVVKAFVVLTEQAQKMDQEQLLKELQDFCKENLTYKYPRKIEFVEAAFLPKTISGKIQRKKLKQLEWAGERSKL